MKTKIYVDFSDQEKRDMIDALNPWRILFSAPHLPSTLPETEIGNTDAAKLVRRLSDGNDLNKDVLKRGLEFLTNLRELLDQQSDEKYWNDIHPHAASQFDVVAVLTETRRHQSTLASRGIQLLNFACGMIHYYEL